MAVRNAKIFTISGVSGGSGKTATVLNLAGIYAKKEYKTLIIDLDLSLGTVAYSLNLDVKSDVFKLVEDLNSNKFKGIEDYVSKYNEFIDVLPACKDPRYASKIKNKYISILLEKYKHAYDIILIDASCDFDEINLVAFDESDKLLFLMKNQSADLKNMKTLVSILKDMDRKNYLIALNESVDSNKSYFQKSDIKNVVRRNIDYTIPSSFYINDIDRYTLKGEIPTLNKKLSSKYKKGIKNLTLIAESLLKEKVK